MISEIVFNAGYLLSYALQADNYGAYKLAKWVSRTLIVKAAITPKPNYADAEITIEGYAHSGNSFMLSNLACPQKAISHNHRPWVIRESIAKNIPTVVLLREPLRCSLSKYQRSRKRRLAYAHTLYPSTILATWYLYYSYIWTHRDRVYLLPFEVMVNDYQQTADLISGISRARVRSKPEYNQQNALGEELEDVRLSKIAQWILKRCRRLYETMLTHARREIKKGWQAHESCYKCPRSMSQP